MEENREVYSRIDSETRDMREVVANVKIPEECRGGKRYEITVEDARGYVEVYCV